MAGSYTVKDTTNSKATTSNKTFELTKYLITKKTIDASYNILGITSMTISFNVSNEYKGYHKVHFYIVINNGNNEIRYDSPYKENIYGNGGYTRVTLTIPISDSIRVSDYNTYINNSQVKLYMSVTRTSGSGTLWFRGDNGDDPYITYNLGETTRFVEPLQNTEFKQYTKIEGVIENTESGDYQIYINGVSGTTEEFEGVTKGQNLSYEKFIGGLEIGNYTLVCAKKNGNEWNEICSVNFIVIENQIFSVIPEFSRYNFNGITYESSFNGDYVGLKLNITTLVSDFIDINYYAKLQYNTNNFIEFENVTAQQFILDVFSLEGEHKPSNELNTLISFSIFNNKTDGNNNNNAIYTLEIQVPQPSVIFNVEENGVSVGMLSHMKNQFESAWPAIFYDSIYLTDTNDSTKYYKLGISNGVIVITEENPFSNNS